MIGRMRDHYCKLSALMFLLSITDRPTRFLYTLFIAVDGNFKLKGKQCHLKDVELMPGWGAYVPEEEYQAHIANYVDQPEVSVVCGYQWKPLTHNSSNRSIRASLSMTHSSELLLDRRLDMLCLEIGRAHV